MKKYVIMILCFIWFVPSFVLAEEATENESTGATTLEVQLEKCIDGKSAKFKTNDGGIMTYQLLAIDTPELNHVTKGEEPFSKEASDYTCNALTNASKIVLELDSNVRSTDSSEQVLAWVFVDDVLLQESLISMGYAKVAYLYENYKYSSLLLENETIAKERKLGVWAVDTVSEKKEEESPKEKEKSKGFWEQLFDNILEKITASINQMVDSILQKLEDML